uniref:Uncharacterized protein n=1 Tax=Arundo donax TaxID=35708 RepID=A0A0A8ZZ90_ARUDO
MESRVSPTRRVKRMLDCMGNHEADVFITDAGTNEENFRKCSLATFGRVRMWMIR